MTTPFCCLSVAGLEICSAVGSVLRLTHSNRRSPSFPFTSLPTSPERASLCSVVSDMIKCPVLTPTLGKGANHLHLLDLSHRPNQTGSVQFAQTKAAGGKIDAGFQKQASPCSAASGLYTQKSIRVTTKGGTRVTASCI